MCAHNDWETKKNVPCCAAFPDGIPYDIYWENAPHITPREGDNGITFAVAPLEELRKRGLAP
jgi:hypothetical protein